MTRRDSGTTSTDRERMVERQLGDWAAALAYARGSEAIGDVLFECGGVRIGLEICRDAWVADRTGARLAQRGADVLLNPSASICFSLSPACLLP